MAAQALPRRTSLSEQQLFVTTPVKPKRDHREEYQKSKAGEEGQFIERTEFGVWAVPLGDALSVSLCCRLHTLGGGVASDVHAGPPDSIAHAIIITRRSVPEELKNQKVPTRLVYSIMELSTMAMEGIQKRIH